MNNNLKDWACSLSGCDGGNISASTWLCGIEWGGASGEDGIYYEEQLEAEIERGEGVPPLDFFDWEVSIKYRYGVSFAKLYAAIQGERVEDYRSLALNNWNGSALFKLNLYPIAFDSTDPQLWHKNELDRITGFDNKYLFNTWCFFNRFPYFSRLCSKHKPKLIICTGVNYLRDFLMFFGGNNDIGKIETGTINPATGANSYDRTYYWAKINDGQTTLAIIPFFSGRYGLNSNHLLQEMGTQLAKFKDII